MASGGIRGYLRAYSRADDEASSSNGVASGRGAAERGPDYCGDFRFGLSYDFPSQTLTIRIVEAKRLPAADFTGTSDPYVVLTLLPKKYKVQTKIKKKTLSPRWHETFLFEDFPLEKLRQMTLHFKVFDWDRFARDDPLGELYVTLLDVDFTQTHDIWKELIKPKNADRNKCGEILLNLCYANPTLSVEIVECKDLRAKDIVVNSSDPYVKIWLSYSGKRMEKQKTTCYKRTLNPTFNEKFDFLVPLEKIREASLTVMVMDWDRLGRNELIGKVLLAAKSEPSSVAHWNQMWKFSPFWHANDLTIYLFSHTQLQFPKKAVSVWHTLKE